MSHSPTSTPQDNPSGRSSPTLIARMSAMMFLQFWPLGTWGVTVGTYIAANTGDRGTGIFSSGFIGYSTAAGAIGSLLSPLVIGFLSDRYFAADRLVAVMQAGCALAAWQMSQTQSQQGFFLWLLMYYQCFSPATALTNKIALRHLANSDKEFPLVRLFGTIGWITAGLFIGLVWPSISGSSIEMTRTPLLVGAIGNLLIAGYALTLPHTPSELKRSDILPAASRDTASILHNRELIAFMAILLLACIPSMAYNNYGNVYLNEKGFWHPAALMTAGQVSEVFVLTATPWLISRFGLRALFAAGIAAWCVRYVFLAAASFYDIRLPAYGAILIHGFCYVFIYIVGVMYVDHLVPHAHRGLAQGIFTIVSAGVANLLGALTVGFTQSQFLTPAGVTPPPYHWLPFWLIPAAISAVTLLLFKFTLKAPIRSAGS